MITLIWDIDVYFIFPPDEDPCPAAQQFKNEYLVRSAVEQWEIDMLIQEARLVMAGVDITPRKEPPI
jgi:hypothetical protein